VFIAAAMPATAGDVCMEAAAAASPALAMPPMPEPGARPEPDAAAAPGEDGEPVCITMSSCAGKSPDLSSGSACFVQGWRLLSSLVVFGYFMSECVLR
jgi:hypothetical protein